jgi:hypothetical protein
MIADATESESAAFRGRDQDPKHPRFKSGVFKMCPLSLLPYWDMVWDFLPDWMHMTKGYYNGHMLLLLKGQRQPGKPTLLANPTQDRKITQ